MDAQDGLTYDFMFGPRLPWSQDTIKAQWAMTLFDLFYILRYVVVSQQKNL